MEWTNRKLKPGDHIRVKRPYYYHHGIYIGENKVIHYSSDDGDGLEHPEKVEVMESSLDFFLQNEMVEVAKPSFKEKFLSHSRRKCIKLAKSSLGKKGYNFLHNNCETFANYCAYRKPLTSQIEDFKKAL